MSKPLTATFWSWVPLFGPERKRSVVRYTRIAIPFNHPALFGVMILYCSQCGVRLYQDAEYCPECGHRSPASMNPAAVSDAAAPVQRTWGLWHVVLGVGILIPATVLFGSLGLILPLAIATVVSTGLLGGAQVALVWGLGPRNWSRGLAAVGLVAPRASGVVTVGLTIAAVVASLGFSVVYTMLVTWQEWQPLIPPQPEPAFVFANRLAILSIVALAVWTPFVEELFFRGFVFRGLANRWGNGVGLVLSAVVFAAMHYHIGLLLPILVTGLLLGGLYWRTGSLWPSIVVHAIQNGIATIAVIYGL